MHFLNCAANKDMFKLNLMYSISWLICLLRCIKIELNWIGIERKWIELELNWKILNPIWIGIELNWKIPNPTWIGIELNWKKWIDPSPDREKVWSKDVTYIPVSVPDFEGKWCTTFTWLYVQIWRKHPNARKHQNGVQFRSGRAWGYFRQWHWKHTGEQGMQIMTTPLSP